MKTVPITEADIDASRTPKGGWDAKTLEDWGVDYPPSKGWIKRLVASGAPANSAWAKTNKDKPRANDPTDESERWQDREWTAADRSKKIEILRMQVRSAEVYLSDIRKRLAELSGEDFL